MDMFCLKTWKCVDIKEDVEKRENTLNRCESTSENVKKR